MQKLYKTQGRKELAFQKHLSHALIMASALVLAGCAKSPESTIESFYHALDRGEINEAKTYISAQLASMAGEQKLTASLVAESERIRKCGGIKHVEVKLEGEGEIRSGMTNISYGGACPQKTEKSKLIKEDGKWKLTADK